VYQFSATIQELEQAGISTSMILFSNTFKKLSLQSQMNGPFKT